MCVRAARGAKCRVHRTLDGGVRCGHAYTPACAPKQNTCIYWKSIKLMCACAPCRPAQAHARAQVLTISRARAREKTPCKTLCRRAARSTIAPTPPQIASHAKPHPSRRAQPRLAAALARPQAEARPEERAAEPQHQLPREDLHLRGGAARRARASFARDGRSRGGAAAASAGATFETKGNFSKRNSIFETKGQRVK